MQRMWKVRNLPGEVIDITPFANDLVERGVCEFYDEVSRGMEINQWIIDNNVDCYCIIDDDNDMLPNQMDDFVRTANNSDHPDCVIGFGLTKKCSEKAVEILNKYTS